MSACVRCAAPTAGATCPVCGAEQSTAEIREGTTKLALTKSEGGDTAPVVSRQLTDTPPPGWFPFDSGSSSGPQIFPPDAPDPAYGLDPPIKPSTRRRALLVVGGTAILVVATLLAANLILGVPLLPRASDRAQPVAAPASSVKFEPGLYFTKGSALSDRSAFPSLMVAAHWQQPAGKICSESGSARAEGSHEPAAATFTKVGTQLAFPAVTGKPYVTAVAARVCAAPTDEVLSTAKFAWTLHQETAAKYSDGWVVGHCRCWSGKSILASTDAGQTAVFTGNFTSFGLITDQGNNRGTADIYLDGIQVGSIDGYVPQAVAPMQVTFALRAKSGDHTVVVKVTSGRVDVDAFVTSGEAGPAIKQGAEPLERP